MNENELKSIERYYHKFNEDASSFNDFEANDFIKLLKNNDKNDEAIEVGKTFLSVNPHEHFDLSFWLFLADVETILLMQEQLFELFWYLYILPP